MDRPDHWFCGLLRRRSGCGGVVHELGPATWICSLCYLPHPPWNHGFGLACDPSHYVENPANEYCSTLSLNSWVNSFHARKISFFGIMKAALASYRSSLRILSQAAGTP